MPDRRRLLSATLALVSALLLTGAGARPGKGVAPGDVAPEIAGPMLAGAPVTLSALRGKVVVVDFWASYCGPCLIAMPEFQQLRDELHAKGYADRFEVLGVAVDRDPGRAEAFIERVGVSYPIISDLIGVAVDRFGVWRLPATYVLDTEGRAFRIYHGYGEGFGADIRRHVLHLLNERPG